MVSPGKRGAVGRPVEAAGVHHDAADRRAVAADVLRRGVHRDVGAVVEHAAVDRGGRRVVDDQRQALGMRRVGPGADVDDVELRVADGLGEHETRLVVREPGDGVGVVGIGPAHLDAVLRQRVREQVVRAPVQRRDRDDVVAGPRDVEHGVGHGGLSGGRRAGSEAALERRDALLEDVPRRVHDARVDVARHLEREQVGGVLGVVELVRRRLVDRHCACLRGRVRGLTAVQGDRLGALSTHDVPLVSRPGNEKGPPCPGGPSASRSVPRTGCHLPLCAPGTETLGAGRSTCRAEAPVAAVSSGQFPRPLGMTLRAGA